ncbi:MAG: hypothetical protein AAF553_00315 [Pseudomonadota bacterium]
MSRSSQKDEPKKKRGWSNKSFLVALGVVFGVIFIGSLVKPDQPRPPQEERTEPAPRMMDEIEWKLVAEEVIRKRLRDPDSAEFSDLMVFPRTEGRSAIICGYVNSRNGFGGLTGRQRFIVGGTVLVEEQVTAKQMQIAWN